MGTNVGKNGSFLFWNHEEVLRNADDGLKEVLRKVQPSIRLTASAFPRRSMMEDMSGGQLGSSSTWDKVVSGLYDDTLSISENAQRALKAGNLEKALAEPGHHHGKK